MSDDLKEFLGRNVECQRNLETGKGQFMSLEYATHYLTQEGKPVKRKSPRFFYFWLRGKCMVRKNLKCGLVFFNGFEAVVKWLRKWWYVFLFPLLPILLVIAVIYAITLIIYCIIISIQGKPLPMSEEIENEERYSRHEFRA